MKFTPGPYTQKHTVRRLSARENYKFFIGCQKEKQINKMTKKEKVVTLIVISKYLMAKVIGFLEEKKKRKLNYRYHYLLYAKCDVQYSTCKGKRGDE